jgi:hypothetical protein
MLQIRVLFFSGKPSASSLYLEMEKELMARDNWRVNVPQSNVTEVVEPCWAQSMNFVSVKYLRKEEVAKVAKQVLKLATD